ILEFQAGTQALDAGAANMEVVLVAVYHARHNHFFATEDVGDCRGQFVHLPAIAAQQERLAMAHAPPFAARVRLVPVSADAGFAGAAIVEEDSGLTYLCPFHRILPFARMKAVLADVVLDDVGGMLAFEIADLAVDNEII